MLEIEMTQTGMEKLRTMPMLVKRILRESGVLGLRIMIPFIPFKTGFLRSSTDIFEVARLYLRIMPMAIYARAIDQGMPGGPGRYVPAIGKRLTKSGQGWWPGFKGAFFIKKTFTQMTRKVPILARRMIFDHFAGSIMGG